MLLMDCECVICHFETELDDVALKLSTGRCVCLSCMRRDMSEDARMTKTLRREVEDGLAGEDKK